MSEKKYIKLIGATSSAVLVSDTAEKDFFLEVYSELKDPLGDDYKTITSNIKSAIDEVIVQRQVITIVNMARDYVGSKLFTKILDMRWYNVKALVALIRFINKHPGSDTLLGGKDGVKSIKRRIGNVGRKKLTATEYNNELAKLISDIKHEYNAVLTDDGQVLEIKSVSAVFNKMTPEQKEEMLELLLAEQQQVA